MFYQNQCKVDGMLSMRRASVLVRLSLILLVSRCLVVCVDEIKEQQASVYSNLRQRNAARLLDARGEESLTSSSSSGDLPVNRRTRELIVAQLRELCARHPAVCSSECASFELADEAELVDNPTGIVCVPPEATTTTTTTTTTATPTHRLLHLHHRQQVPKSVLDELLLAVSMASSKLSNETSNEDLGYWTESGPSSLLSAQLENLNDDDDDDTELTVKERLARLLDQSQRGAKLPARVQRQQPTRDNNNNPNTYRVSYEEAKRFIQTQERQRQHFRAAAALVPVRLSDSLWPVRHTKTITTATVMLPTSSSTSRPELESPNQQDHVDLLVANGRRSMRLHRSDGGTSAVKLPKRTSGVTPSPASSVEIGNVISATAATTSGSHQQLATNKQNLQDLSTSSTTTTTTSTTTATTTASADALQCNMRLFTFRATKSDGAGNSCSGLVTASICYGGCDTGEIADWLFPYKKSIHKVCRHGGRIRRRTILRDCTSELDSINENLRTYYYVDARDCVCKKCASVDTTCLGSMTQPQLHTHAETLAAMDRLSDASDDGGGGGGGGGGGDD